MPRRFERKFIVLPEKVGFAYALLRQVCRPDSQYPCDQVNTLYLDTADLEQYVKSASGDFEREKVRIRWYGEDGALEGMTPVYVELKSRQGFASAKQRRRLEVPAESLEPASLGAGVVERTTLVETLAGYGYFPQQPLWPVIAVSYQRYRFTEMTTGMRVSLDCRIRSSAVFPGLGHGERRLPLPNGIVEVKGPSMDIPLALRRLRLLDTDWSRFSKYACCVESQNSDPGTIGRLWPSGRMPEL
jgi:hypothetical protein